MTGLLQSLFQARARRRWPLLAASLCLTALWALPVLAGPSVRWVINSAAGTVVDQRTGRMWQRHPPTVGGSNGQTDGRFNWADAKQYCQDLVLGGFEDWRLPNLQELRRLVDRKRNNPAISPTAFPNTPVSGTSYYWSATPYRSGSSSAWGVYFGTGSVSSSGVSSYFRVRCVR